MTWTAESLRPQYSRFLKDYPYLLFANHSHQAWPNVARFGQLKAFDLAAERHGDKWEGIEEARRGLKQFISQYLGNGAYGGEAGICWGESTFALLSSFLSALDLKPGSVLLTSDAEFHSLRRLLSAWEERGVKVLRVASYTEEEVIAGEIGRDFFSRLHGQLKDVDIGAVAAILFSSVSFKTGSLLPNFASELSRLLSLGPAVLVDLYHHIGPMPFQIPELGQENLYLVGGGYKYLQMGEGNCWMRAPLQSELRPWVTGWFAEMQDLTKAAGELQYPAGAERFRAATYEPSAILRAAEVARFFRDIGFTPESLAADYRHKVTSIFTRLQRLLDRLPADYCEAEQLALLSHQQEEWRGGFVALRFRQAARLHDFLQKHRIETDYRDNIIRFGPAPYTLASEIDTLLDAITDFFEGEF